MGALDAHSLRYGFPERQREMQRVWSRLLAHETPLDMGEVLQQLGEVQQQWPTSLYFWNQMQPLEHRFPISEEQGLFFFMPSWLLQAGCKLHLEHLASCLPWGWELGAWVDRTVLQLAKINYKAPAKPSPGSCKASADIR